MSKTLVAPPAEIKALLRLVVTDPSGKILNDSGEQPSHSFVQGFLKFITGVFTATTITCNTTAGVSSKIYGWDEDIAGKAQYIGAPVNNSSYGIVIGTGNAAEDNTDYKLATQLTEGVAAGQITHNACTVNAAAAVVGANVDLVLVRSFTNQTGALITVKEAGVYIKRLPTTPLYFCHARDVLASAADVPDKCSITVFYTLRTTV